MGHGLPKKSGLSQHPTPTVPGNAVDLRNGRNLPLRNAKKRTIAHRAPGHGNPADISHRGGDARGLQFYCFAAILTTTH